MQYTFSEMGEGKLYLMQELAVKTITISLLILYGKNCKMQNV